MATRIPYPFKGVDQNWSFADQPPATTREEVNMVVIDPINGRTRGAQRAGTVKWNPFAPVEAGEPVREIITVKQPVDKVTYSEIGAGPELKWSHITDSKGASRVVRLDRQRNSIWLEDYNVIRLRNRDGREVWNVSIPVASSNTFCRTMEVDEYDAIYVGVSDLDKSENGRLFTYQVQEQDKPPVLISTLKVTGAIADIKWNGGFVYLALNDHDLRRSKLTRVVSADVGAPEIDQQWDVPYPCNAVAVRKDGTIYTASPPFSGRLETASGEGQSFVNWTPKNLKNWQQRVWSWFDASDIDGNETYNAAYKDLDSIGLWFNKAVNSPNRQLWDDIKQTKITNWLCRPGAQLRKKAIAGLDALWFAGGATNVDGSGLHSHPSQDSANNSMETAFGILPNTQLDDPIDYECAYAIFMVIRPATTEEGQAVLTGRYNGGDNNHWILSVNHAVTATRPDNTSPLLAGRLGIYDGRVMNGISVGGNVYGNPLSGKFNKRSGTVVVTILHDNGMETTVPNSEGYRGAFYINGQPIDRWTTDETYNTRWPYPPIMSMVGVDGNDTNRCWRFEGYICELIVMRYDPNASSYLTRRPIWGPAYPDVAYQAGGDSEQERMEGYLAWKWGIGQDLENQNAAGGGTLLTYKHPFGPGDLNSPPDPNGRGQSGGVTSSSILTTTNAVIAKWTTGGTLVWAYSTATQGGYGSGLAWDETNGLLFSVGPKNLSGSSTYSMVCLKDLGESWTQRSPLPLIDSFGEYELGPDHVDIQLDAFGNLWVPLNDPGHKITKVLNTQLREAAGWGIPGSFNTTATPAKHLLQSNNQAGTSIAVPRDKDDYGDETLNWPPEVWLASTKRQESVLTLLSSPASTGQVVIGPITYQLKPTASYTGAPYQVLWNNASPSSFENLYKAINADESGNYGAGTAAHPQVRAVKFALNPTYYGIWISVIKAGAFDIALSATSTIATWSPTGISQDLTSQVSHKYRLIDETVNTAGPARLVTTLAVAGGFVKIADTSTMTLPAGSGSISQATDPALDPNGVPYGTVLFGKVYFVDGTHFLRYTPKTDVLEEFIPDASGVPPKRIYLLETWRGRLVAFSRDNPWNYWMSRSGKPEDWNYYPPEVTADQATFGNHPQSTGLVPDIVNGFVPITDDLALFGCDSSLYRLTGDPMAGGQIDFVSAITGMAPGRAWVIDPQGMIYFFGSRGGIYRMNPYSGALDRISRYRIERATQDVDLSLYRIRMIWDYERDGLLVCVVPYGYPSATTLPHWFWDEKNDRWSTFQFGVLGDTTVQPTALSIIDGDAAEDRSLLLGCEDGYIRTFDNFAKDDDGVAIDSRVVIGPLGSADADFEARYGGLTVVLGSEYNGAMFEYFAAPTWTDVGAVKVRGQLQAGRNRTVMDSVKGPAVWLRLRNPWANQRWAYEVAHIEVAGMGEPREQ